MEIFETLAEVLRPDFIEDQETIDIDHEVVESNLRVTDKQIQSARQRMIEIHES